MPISFKKLPIGSLNPRTGEATNVGPPRTPPPDIGIPTPEFHKQVLDLIAKKVPLEKANQAIDAHPDIHDKPRAKSMAAAVYAIIAKKTGGKSKNMVQ